MRAFDTPWGRAAILVCEDAWHSLSGTVAALDDAQLIFLSSAAPARGVWPRDDAIPGPASVARWERLVRDIAEEHGVFVTFANLVGSEGGKMFPGASMVMGPRGDVRVARPCGTRPFSPRRSTSATSRARGPTCRCSRTCAPRCRICATCSTPSIGIGVRPPVEWDPAPASDREVRRHGAPSATGATTAAETARCSVGRRRRERIRVRRVHRSRRRGSSRCAAAARHRRQRSSSNGSSHSFATR